MVLSVASYGKCSFIVTAFIVRIPLMYIISLYGTVLCRDWYNYAYDLNT